MGHQLYLELFLELQLPVVELTSHRSKGFLDSGQRKMTISLGNIATTLPIDNQSFSLDKAKHGFKELFIEAEERELRKYAVDAIGGNYATE